MSKGSHKAVVANGVIVGCEYCGRPPPCPSGGCDSNLLPVPNSYPPFDGSCASNLLHAQGKIYLILIIVPQSKFCIIYLFFVIINIWFY